MNAYNSAAYNAYLSQMTSYPPGIDKDLMMISQMYNSPYSSILASSSNPATRNTNLSSLANYSPMFGQGGSLYNTASSILPNSTSPTTPYAAAAALYSSALSSAAAAASTSPYASSGITTTTPSYTNMLSNFLPNFSNAASGISSGSTATPTTSGRTSQNQTQAENLSRSIEKEMMGYLTNASNLSMHPGPNALKNPMLSKELSMPSLVPVSNVSAKDPAFNLPSIPTSVITKTSALPTNLSSTNIRRASPSISPLGNAGLIGNAHHRTSPNPISSHHRTSPGAIGPLHRTSPSSINSHHRVNTTAPAARPNTVASTSIGNRGSPAVNIIPSSSNRSSHTAASISLGGGENRLSPEPHIIVKDVNAINQSVKSSTPTKPAVNKSPAPIKNINIGIVYPPKKDTTAFDLTHNDSILETARNQLNALGGRGMTVTSSNVTVSPQTSTSSSSSRQTMGHITQQQVQQQRQISVANKRLITAARPNNMVTRSPMASPTQAGGSTTMINRSKDTTIIKQSNQLPKSIASDITLSQTGKTLSQQGVSISAVPQFKKVNTYGRPPNATNLSSSAKIAMSPQQIKQQQLLLAAKKNYPQKPTPTLQLGGKTSQPSGPVNPATMTGATVKRLPMSVSGSSGIVRQNSSPILTGNMSMVQARKQGGTVTPKTLPTIVRQNTVPNLKSPVTGNPSVSRVPSAKQMTVVRAPPSVSSRLIGSTTNPTTIGSVTKSLPIHRIPINSVNGENMTARVSSRSIQRGSGDLQSSPIRLDAMKRIVTVKQPIANNATVTRTSGQQQAVTISPTSRFDYV